MLVKYRNQRPSNFDRFFDDFVTRDLFGDLQRKTNLSDPKVNLIETEQGFSLYIQAPGFKKDQFSIELDGELLKISGKVEEAEAENTPTFKRKEFVVRSFSKTFTLNEQVNAEQIAADYEGGILKLTLPKLEKQEKQVKTIDVK